MPTISQLSNIWETQFEFFGGFGQPRATYIGTSEGTSEGHGLTAEKLVDTPLIPKETFHEFSGEDIGELKYNPATGDLKVYINTEESA